MKVPAHTNVAHTSCMSQCIKLFRKRFPELVRLRYLWVRQQFFLAGNGHILHAHAERRLLIVTSSIVTQSILVTRSYDKLRACRHVVDYTR